MVLDSTDMLWEITRYVSVVILLIASILGTMAVNKFKFSYLLYMLLNISLLAISAIFSVLKFWFFYWEFTLLEYIFLLLFAVSGVFLFFELKKSEELCECGLPKGECID